MSSLLEENKQEKPADERDSVVLYPHYPIVYAEDNLYSCHNTSSMETERFKRAYAREMKTYESGAWAGRLHDKRWRTHIVCWAAATAMRREGDFVECGVCCGGASASLMTYVNWNKSRGGRTFYLMDTFNGLVEELRSEEEKAKGSIKYDECYDDAVRNFEEFQGVKFIRGPVPDTLPQNPTTRVAYLHIDMNCAAPEIAALRHFWPLMSTGGVVLLDDYAYVHFEPQKIAMDALGEELGFEVASLPTGQGLIIK